MRERLLRSGCILFRDSRPAITSLLQHIVKRLVMGPGDTILVSEGRRTCVWPDIRTIMTELYLEDFTVGQRFISETHRDGGPDQGFRRQL